MNEQQSVKDSANQAGFIVGVILTSIFWVGILLWMV